MDNTGVALQSHAGGGGRVKAGRAAFWSRLGCLAGALEVTGEINGVQVTAWCSGFFVSGADWMHWEVEWVGGSEACGRGTVMTERAPPLISETMEKEENMREKERERKRKRKGDRQSEREKRDIWPLQNPPSRIPLAVLAILVDKHGLD
jgi:hypothetical protein